MHILILTGVQNEQISPYTYSFVVVYVCIFPSQKEFKKDNWIAEKSAMNC